MSALITVDLSCDRCANWTAGKSPVGQRRIGEALREARKKARPDGWTTRRQDGHLVDLCAVCSEGAA